jgi:hypothetical protein
VFAITLPEQLAQQTSELVQVVRVVNDTAEPIEITQILQSCSCSTARLAQMILPPNTETTLTITADIRNRSGSQRLVCELRTVAGRSWRCELTATIYQRWQLDPAHLNFGILSPETAALDREITINEFGLADTFAQPLTLTASHTPIQVELVESITLPAGNGILQRRSQYRVRVQPAQLTKDITDVHLVARAHQVDERIPISWYSQALVTAQLPRVVIRADEREPLMTRTVRLRRSDGQPFALDRITGATEQVSVTTQHVTPAEVVVTLTIRATSPKQPIYTSLDVFLVGQTEAALSIPCAVLPMVGNAIAN